MSVANKLCFLTGAAVIGIGMTGGIEVGRDQSFSPPGGDESYAQSQVSSSYSVNRNNLPPGAPETNPWMTNTPGASADPSGLQTGSYRGDVNAAEGIIGTYNVGYDEDLNGWCARGVSKILEAYTGMPITSTSGANAKHMGPILTGKFGMTAVADNGSYQNGDTRVLQNSGAGHIETYMNGRWVSDFVQNGPSTGNPRYSGSQLYRFL
jgi:hypothetical protein